MAVSLVSVTLNFLFPVCSLIAPSSLWSSLVLSLAVSLSLKIRFSLLSFDWLFFSIPLLHFGIGSLPPPSFLSVSQRAVFLIGGPSPSPSRGHVVEPRETGHQHVLLPPPAVSPVRGNHHRVTLGLCQEVLPGADDTALPGRQCPRSPFSPSLHVADTIVAGGVLTDLRCISLCRSMIHENIVNLSI